MKTAIILFVILVLIGLGIIINGNLSIAQTQSAYIGIDKCKTCHQKNFEAFSERRFDKSWKTIEMRKKEKDPECLKCHVTGYGQPGGFVSEEATPHLLYKQCEVCHGPGSFHAGNPTDKEYQKTIAPYKYSNENICIKCHLCMVTHKAEESF